MKEIPKYKKIEQNMKAGKISLTGFLGNDERPLFEIISDDKNTLINLNITSKEIAQKLKYFRDKAFNFDGIEIIVDEKWKVSVNSNRGRIKCPFEDKGGFIKTEIRLIYIPENIEILYTDLSIHLIEFHDFYGGKGSYYRLEPEILKKALQL